MFIKKKYIAIFLTKEKNSYTITKAKRFNPSNKKFIDSNLIDISNYTFSKGLKNYYYLDKDNKLQLNFDINQKLPNIDIKAVDDVLVRSIISQLTKDMSGSNLGKKIFDIIIGLVIGGLVGFIASGIAFGGIG